MSATLTAALDQHPSLPMLGGWRAGHATGRAGSATQLAYAGGVAGGAWSCWVLQRQFEGSMRPAAGLQRGAAGWLGPVSWGIDKLNPGDTAAAESVSMGP
jgi:hypothetical protein